MKSVLLLGRDYVDLGVVGEAAAGDVAAVISRGGALKTYAHVDPNEDAALGAAGARGALVAVADGHWGHRAAERVLEQLLEDHAAAWVEGGPRAPEAWRESLQLALADLNEAALSVHDAEDRSRTTLALAVARPAENLVISASIGDSLLFLVRARDAAELPRPRKTSFLGQPRRASAVARQAQVALLPLDEALALVAATDGLSEPGIGVGDPAAAVRTAAFWARERTRERRASEVARAVAEAALGAQRMQSAGDNVAVSVAWLGP